jgi:5-methylcytosine-specific restriction endonuclease McrA
MACDRIKKRENRQKNIESYRKAERKRAAARLKTTKEWMKRNKAHLKKQQKNYREENREDRNAKLRAYYYQNIDSYRARGRDWREKNREKSRISNRNRRARLKNAEGSHSAEDIKKIYEKQKGVCAACGVEFFEMNYHVDHIYPLCLGGSNWPSNLQLLCASCNCSKGANPPEQFYKKRGLLL